MATQYITLADGTRIPVEGVKDYDAGTDYDFEGALNNAGYVSVNPGLHTWLNQNQGTNFSSPEAYLQWIYGGGNLEDTSQGQYFKTPSGVQNFVNTPLSYDPQGMEFADYVLAGMGTVAGLGLGGYLPGTESVFGGAAGAGNVLDGMDLSGYLTNVDDFAYSIPMSGVEGAGAAAGYTGGPFPYDAQFFDGSMQTIYDNAANMGITGYDPALTSGVAAGGAAGSSLATMGGGSLMDTLSKLPGSAIDWIKANPAAAAQIFGTTVQGISSFLASRAQTQAADRANDTIWNMYQQNRADMTPWREAGVTALNQLTKLTTPGQQFDTMMLDPGYQFRLSEGEKGIDRMAAGRGSFDSGATLKALTRFNQDYSTGEFNNVYNRLAGLSGTGQTATSQIGNYGQNAANTMAGNQIGAGNARASGYVGVGNAINSGVGNMLNYYQNNELMNRLLSGGR